MDTQGPALRAGDLTNKLRQHARLNLSKADPCIQYGPWPCPLEFRSDITNRATV